MDFISWAEEPMAFFKLERRVTGFSLRNTHQVYAWRGVRLWLEIIDSVNKYVPSACFMSGPRSLISDCIVGEADPQITKKYVLR